MKNTVPSLTDATLEASEFKEFHGESRVQVDRVWSSTEETAFGAGSDELLFA
jgi:hypothetical protein